MTSEEFKQWGYRFVDWAADYIAHPENHAVLSQVSPGDIRKQLPAEPPSQPESFEQIRFLLTVMRPNTFFIH